MHALIETHRAELLDLARRRGVVDVRVFGSMSRGDGGDHSDVDLLVTLAPGTSALALGGLLLDAQELLGRRVDIVRDVSRAANFPVVVPTGIYREPWVPDWAHAANEDALRDWMLGELTGQIEDSGVQAAWIKLSAGDDGITEPEAKILRAAAAAAKEVNALIGSHTIRGSVVRSQLDIIEAAGYTASRYIWIHTQAEPDFELHLEMGRRGCWLEYDAVGSEAFTDEWFINRIIRVLDSGLGKQLLVSHDRGWYDPSQPDAKPQHFTYLTEVFLPKLSAAGVDDATIRQLTVENPFNAFAR